MSRAATNKIRELAAPQRGHIIQRVLVDGWTPAQAGAAFGVGERQVAAWVAAYRRFGMASLRGEAGKAFAPLRWIRRMRAAMERALIGIDGDLVEPPPVRCIVLRRAQDQGSRRAQDQGSGRR